MAYFKVICQLMTAMLIVTKKHNYNVRNMRKTRMGFYKTLLHGKSFTVIIRLLVVVDKA